MLRATEGVTPRMSSSREDSSVEEEPPRGGPTERRHGGGPDASTGSVAEVISEGKSREMATSEVTNEDEALCDPEKTEKFTETRALLGDVKGEKVPAGACRDAKPTAHADVCEREKEKTAGCRHWGGYPAADDNAKHCEEKEIWADDPRWENDLVSGKESNSSLPPQPLEGGQWRWSPEGFFLHKSVTNEAPSSDIGHDSSVWNGKGDREGGLERVDELDPSLPPTPAVVRSEPTVIGAVAVAVMDAPSRKEAARRGTVWTPGVMSYSIVGNVSNRDEAIRGIGGLSAALKDDMMMSESESSDLAFLSVTARLKSSRHSNRSLGIGSDTTRILTVPESRSDTDPEPDSSPIATPILIRTQSRRRSSKESGTSNRSWMDAVTIPIVKGEVLKSMKSVAHGLGKVRTNYCEGRLCAVEKKHLVRMGWLATFVIIITAVVLMAVYLTIHRSNSSQATAAQFANSSSIKEGSLSERYHALGSTVRSAALKRGFS